ncbi:hypothetical protein WHR41_04824 [Cladosporium halotolerans]|uniref:Auxiliary Activity family 9 catalytic domain-containing protein n=1 Tax=Cladosporium halotolerans TaxID=1052096 RepID=A0AB34KQI1_9PEZI
MAFLQTAALLGSLAASAYAHGRVTSITAEGESYDGFITDYIYTPDPPAIVAWSAANGDNGFVDGTAYATGDIICHKEAKPGQISAKVAAGDTVEVQWGPDAWPESHHGPVIDYLAKCDGDDCTTVDKETLKFFKIDEAGLINGSPAPGQWASDELIANDGKWQVTIPESLAPGQYVLRHEIIALHGAGSENGAQNYPQCFNLEVTGSGTANPEGVLGTALYTPTDAGIMVGIYGGLDSYTIPGPALWDGATSGSTGGNSSTGSAPFGNGTTTAAPEPTAASTQPATAVSSAAAAVTKVADTASTSSGSTSSGSTTTTTAETDAEMPSKPLPEGFTLDDLLAWVNYLLSSAWNDSGVHARDVSRR